MVVVARARDRLDLVECRGTEGLAGVIEGDVVVADGESGSLLKVS